MAQELVALAYTIKVLNDGDTMEFFKRALPSAKASLLHIEGGQRSSAVSARFWSLSFRFSFVSGFQVKGRLRARARELWCNELAGLGRWRSQGSLHGPLSRHMVYCL